MSILRRWAFLPAAAGGAVSAMGHLAGSVDELGGQALAEHAGALRVELSERGVAVGVGGLGEALQGGHGGDPAKAAGAHGVQRGAADEGVVVLAAGREPVVDRRGPREAADTERDEALDHRPWKVLARAAPDEP